MARACFYCGKQIKGVATVIVPPMLLVKLFGEFTKTYHPTCYEKSEAKAGEELTKGAK